MRGIRRLLVLVVLAAVAFAVALVSLDEDARQACAVEAEEDGTYAVELLDTPSTGETAQRLAVTRQGEPVTGARVCLRAQMVGMEAMTVSDEADEVEPGVYETQLRFEMGGAWEATVLVEDGGTERAVAVTFDVTR
ncbi:MAG TPA: FixH family protein [Acidimicrobiales bacterium]|nr:FixH family protein [Acidimicrobiales bacterium]